MKAATYTMSKTLYNELLKAHDSKKRRGNHRDVLNYINTAWGLAFYVDKLNIQ